MLNAPHRQTGFSLIELLTVLVIASILVALGFPIIGNWVKNSQVRTAAETLQNGLRYAENQAVTQNVQTALVLANSPPANTTTATPANPSSSWYSATVTTVNGVALLTPSIVATGLQTGSLGNVAAGVQIAGAVTAVCFNSFGRLAANTTPGPTGTTCTLPTTPTANPVFIYNITNVGADRPLRVTVGLSGQVRMCDPAKTLSASNPDGC